jgi:hypothetical protein
VGLEVEAPAIWVKLDPLRPNSDEIISHGVLLIAEDPRLSVERLSDSNTFVLAVSKNCSSTRLTIQRIYFSTNDEASVLYPDKTNPFSR